MSDRIVAQVILFLTQKNILTVVAFLNIIEIDEVGENVT